MKVILNQTKLNKAQLSDLPCLAEIEHKIGFENRNIDVLKKYLSLPFEFFVLKYETITLGYLILQNVYPESEMIQLSIHPCFQKQGIGHYFLTSIMNNLANQHYETLYLEVRKSNINAIKLYEKLNFKKIAERKNYYPTVNGFENAIIYEFKFKQVC